MHTAFKNSLVLLLMCILSTQEDWIQGTSLGIQHCRVLGSSSVVVSKIQICILSLRLISRLCVIYFACSMQGAHYRYDEDTLYSATVVLVQSTSSGELCEK